MPRYARHRISRTLFYASHLRALSELTDHRFKHDDTLNGMCASVSVILSYLCEREGIRVPVCFNGYHCFNNLPGRNLILDITATQFQGVSQRVLLRKPSVIWQWQVQGRYPNFTRLKKGRSRKSKWVRCIVNEEINWYKCSMDKVVPKQLELVTGEILEKAFEQAYDLEVF